MDHLARQLPLVADHRHPGLEQGKAIETQSPQHQADRGAGQAQRPGNRGPGQTLPAQVSNLRHLRFAQLMRTTNGGRAAVVKRPIARSPALQPAMRGAFGHPGIGCCLPHRNSLVDPIHHLDSTTRRQTRILMDVHSGSSAEGWLVLQPQLLSPSPNEQPS